MSCCLLGEDIAFFAGDFVENDLRNEVTKLVPKETRIDQGAPRHAGLPFS